MHTFEKYIQLALITVSRSSRELDIFMWKDHTEENIQNTKVIDQKISTFQIQIAKCEEKNIIFQNKILNNNTLKPQMGLWDGRRECGLAQFDNDLRSRDLQLLRPTFCPLPIVLLFKQTLSESAIILHLIVSVTFRES